MVIFNKSVFKSIINIFISNTKIFCEKNYFAFIPIVGLSFFVWHKILNQVFLGEGYYYFNRTLDLIGPHGFNFEIRAYDNFARLLFDIFPPLFRDNIQAYMFLELLIITVLYLSIYYVITTITKSKMIGFLATVFFLANYVGSFYLIADGNYQRFVQRIPNFIPAIFSFYYLFKFYNTKGVSSFAYHEKRNKYYLYSLGLYILALLMGHFSSIILPLFFLYPLMHLLQEKKTIRSFFTRMGVVIPFLLITFYITRTGDQSPAGSLWHFLLTEPDVLKRVLYQIPLVTVPLDIIKFFAKTILTKPESEPYSSIVPFFTLISLIFYIIGGIIVYKRRKDLIILYITCFLSMIGSMFLYMYIDVRINPLKYFGADRWYLVSSLLAAICWGIFLKVIFIKQKVFPQLILMFILSFYIFYNTSLIWKHIDSSQYKSEMMKSFLKYIKVKSSQFNSKTVIIVPSYLQWPAPLIIEYGDHPGMIVRSEFDGWESKYWDVKENVYVFDYEYDKNVDKAIYPQVGQVVDFSEKYRRGEKIQFLN